MPEPTAAELKATRAEIKLAVKMVDEMALMITSMGVCKADCVVVAMLAIGEAGLMAFAKKDAAAAGHMRNSADIMAQHMLKRAEEKRSA